MSFNDSVVAFARGDLDEYWRLMTEAFEEADALEEIGGGYPGTAVFVPTDLPSRN